MEVGFYSGITFILGYRIYQTQNIAVGRACNQNGGASYTKESPATSNPMQEMDRKTQETMERWSERGCRHVSWHTS